MNIRIFLFFKLVSDFLDYLLVVPLYDDWSALFRVYLTKSFIFKLDLAIDLND